MLKRILSMALCIVMLMTMLPVQTFAGEIPAEETTVPTETTAPTTEAAEETTAPPETTAVPETEAATEPAQTVPAETVPEETEPAETVPEETEPVETEPEETELVPVMYTKPSSPHYWYLTEEVYTWTEDVTVMEPNEDGSYRMYDTTQTFTDTYLERHEVGGDGASALSVTQSGNNTYIFTEFEDLEQLAQGTYDSWTIALYQGEYPFVIERSITLPLNLQLRFDNDDSSMVIPEGVTFANTFGTGSGSIRVGHLTVDGTFRVNDTLCVVHSLDVTGQIRLEENTLMMEPGATVSGSKNVTVNGSNLGPRWDYTVYNASELQAAVSAAKKDTTGWDYLVELSTNYGDVTLSSSLTIPENMQLNIYGSGTFTVASGATLTVDAFYCYWNAPITIDGKLVNNCSKVYVWSPVTVNGSYSGTGALYVNKAEFSTWDEGVSGLSLSNVVVSDASWGDWWVIRDINGMTRLGTPTNLAWNKRVVGKNGKASIVNAKGHIYWKAAEPDNNQVIVRFYDYATDELISTWNCGFGGQPTNDRSVDAFITIDPPSGTYYFTVTSMPGYGSEYFDSISAASGK